MRKYVFYRIVSNWKLMIEITKFKVYSFANKILICLHIEFNDARVKRSKTT